MRVHEDALNDAMNYAQKGCAVQMRGITLTCFFFAFDVVHYFYNRKVELSSIYGRSSRKLFSLLS